MCLMSLEQHGAEGSWFCQALVKSPIVFHKGMSEEQPLLFKSVSLETIRSVFKLMFLQWTEIYPPKIHM